MRTEGSERINLSKQSAEKQKDLNQPFCKRFRISYFWEFNGVFRLEKSVGPDRVQYFAFGLYSDRLSTGHFCFETKLVNKTTSLKIFSLIGQELPGRGKAT